MTQPGLFFFIQIRGYLFINFPVICVEHFPFLFGHASGQKSVQIYRDKGQYLKTQELPVFILCISAHKELIFQADSMGSLDIDSRLIRDHHIFFKYLSRPAAFAPPKIDRRLVDIQKISYSVSGPVIKIKPFLPEHLPCQSIQRHATGAVEKNCV